MKIKAAIHSTLHQVSVNDEMPLEANLQLALARAGLATAVLAPPLFHLYLWLIY